MPSGDTPDLNLLFPQRTAAAEQKLFGRYTLKRVLGRGGMGIVWMAHDDELHRHVAMKFLPDMLIRDREAVNDLKRETRRSLDLTHHHIVRIYDFTQDDVCAAIIMEYVDGETLSAMKTHQSGGCFSVSMIAAWVAHFCQALDYAHRQARVVHRDLKPANLMVNSRGDLKVTDFGISRSMSDSMTRVSMSNTAGTLAYMSPEQALGAPPAACDDIYAFGATIYDLLTGRPPFFRGNIQVQLETVIPPKMGDRREELGNQGEPIPDLWEEVIKACLAKRPHDRPKSLGEVATMLGLAATSPVRAAYSSGGASAPGAGGSGTASTVLRTRSTDDAATRTDAVPPVPQTTKRATAETRGTTYVSTPRPTALRDVIPGYVDEPAEPPATTPPTVQPPATSPTQAKADAPPPTSPSRPVEPEPVPEPLVAEAPAQVEALVEPVAAVPTEEPPPVSTVEPVEPKIEISRPMAAEEIPAAVSDVEAVDVPIESSGSSVEEVVVDSTPAIEIETPVPAEEAEPMMTSASAAPLAEDFPTLVGMPLIEPAAAAEEEIQTIELSPAEAAQLAASVVPLEAEAEITNEPAEEIASPVDEAAETLVDAPLPSFAPREVPTAPIPREAPSTETSSPSVSHDEPDSSPSRSRSLSWLPIVAVAGVVAFIGIWMMIPKDGQNWWMAKNQGRQTPLVQPTPVPLIVRIQEKLDQARSHFANDEYPEAIALLNEVQGLDSNNADATVLLGQIEEAKRKKAERERIAERDRKVDGLLSEAQSARERRNRQEARAKLLEARMLDLENKIVKSELEALDTEEMNQKKAEEEAAALAKREKEAADMKATEAARQEEARREAEAERKRTASQDETPQKKAKVATSRPQRARTEEDSGDRPRRNIVNREDRLPPTPNRTPPKVRATPAPVNRGTAPGG
jgi:serine/threonine protein kinase